LNTRQIFLDEKIFSILIHNFLIFQAPHSVPKFIGILKYIYKECKVYIDTIADKDACV
jgi:hypothetical protein